MGLAYGMVNMAHRHFLPQSLEQLHSLELLQQVCSQRQKALPQTSTQP